MIIMNEFGIKPTLSELYAKIESIDPHEYARTRNYLNGSVTA